VIRLDAINTSLVVILSKIVACFAAWEIRLGVGNCGSREEAEICEIADVNTVPDSIFVWSPAREEIHSFTRGTYTFPFSNENGLLVFEGQFDHHRLTPSFSAAYIIT
jgi:hypothetical protein